MLYYNQRRSLLFLLSVISITFTSERTRVSPLELFPGKGFENVSLPHPYHHMTDEEKSDSVYLQEGCYTILDNIQEGACALVGPLQPCQLFCLSSDEKTVIAHLSAESNFDLLLNSIKDQFSNCDKSKITGEIFTNNSPVYDKPILNNSNGLKNASYYQVYQNRTQIEELKNIKNKIISYFDIQDRNQIKAHKFNSSKKDYELGDYELAELFVFVKINNAKAVVFNTCPMAEQYFENLKHLPVGLRLQRFSAILNEKYSKNSFFAKSPKNYITTYNARPFHYIEYPKHQ